MTREHSDGSVDVEGSGITIKSSDWEEERESSGGCVRCRMAARAWLQERSAYCRFVIEINVTIELLKIVGVL